MGLSAHEARIAECAKQGAEIWCIGTNATMLDALRLCQSVVPEEKLRFAACSPRGILPDPLIAREARQVTEPTLNGPYDNAKAFLDDVQNNMQQAQAEGHKMREMRAGFRKFFVENGLRQYLPDMDEASQIPAVLRHWFRGGTRDTIEDFHRLSETNKVRIVRGAFDHVRLVNNGVELVLKERDGELVSHQAGFVINCSGAGSTFDFDPLTHSLIDREWITICKRSCGIQVGEGCQTNMPGMRYLSPAVTVIGEEVMPMPLYDVHLLCKWAARANTYLEK